MKARQFLSELNKVCHFTSKERPGEKASNSELQRWLDQGSVIFNGERVTRDEELDFPIFSLVLNPKSLKQRCTLL